MDNNKIITEKIKKSELNAAGKYELIKLAKAGDKFLPVKTEEGKEEVTFSYAIDKTSPFAEIRGEGQIVTLNILIQAATLYRDAHVYTFSMAPDNIYSSSSGMICIKTRDLADDAEKSRGRFIAGYKALAASTMVNRYSYTDYLEGGEELFEKHEMTLPFKSMNSAEEIADYLEGIKKEQLRKQQEEKIYIKKKQYTLMRASLVVLLALTILFGVYGGIQMFKTLPYYKAVTAADNAHMENDSVGVIKALEDVDGESLDIYQQYILASAYLQGESLTKEQKDNISKRMTLNSNEEVLLYWIYLGRNRAEEAEDIAMQLSDDELLLYAYMKEKANIEADTDISGEEKEAALKEVQGKIDALAKTYQDEE